MGTRHLHWWRKLFCACVFIKSKRRLLNEDFTKYLSPCIGMDCCVVNAHTIPSPGTLMFEAAAQWQLTNSKSEQNFTSQGFPPHFVHARDTHFVDINVEGTVRALESTSQNHLHPLKYPHLSSLLFFDLRLFCSVSTAFHLHQTCLPFLEFCLTISQPLLSHHLPHLCKTPLPTHKTLHITHTHACIVTLFITLNDPFCTQTTCTSPSLFILYHSYHPPLLNLSLPPSPMSPSSSLVSRAPSLPISPTPFPPCPSFSPNLLSPSVEPPHLCRGPRLYQQSWTSQLRHHIISS